jgi:hypothetical protein
LAYFFIQWDKRKPDSENVDDTQVGLKLGLFFLAIIGLGIAVAGLSAFLHYLLSGTKAGTGVLKTGIASVLSGGLFLGAVWFMFLPRTNYSEYPKATRFAVGYVGVICGFVAALSLNLFLVGLFNSAPWAFNSANMANLIVFGGLGVVAISRFGALSGWTATQPRQNFGGGGGFQQPPQGGGFPGGQPPQQQAQGGGFPGGGAPPQGGPVGGGAPPAGGGGFPPAGGGAPPAGGGGFPGGGGGAPPAGGGGQAPGGGGFPAPGGGGGGGGLPPPSGSGGGFPR